MQKVTFSFVKGLNFSITRLGHLLFINNIILFLSFKIQYYFYIVRSIWKILVSFFLLKWKLIELHRIKKWYDIIEKYEIKYVIEKLICICFFNGDILISSWNMIYQIVP